MSNQAKVFDDRACAALAELDEAKRSLHHATQTELALGRDIMRLEVEAEFFKAMAATLRRDYETSTSFKGTMWQRSQEADRLRKAAEDEAVAERTRAEKALAAQAIAEQELAISKDRQAGYLRVLSYNEHQCEQLQSALEETRSELEGRKCPMKGMRKVHRG